MAVEAGGVKRKTLDLTQFSAGGGGAVPLALRPTNVITASPPVVDHAASEADHDAVAQGDTKKAKVRVADLASVFGRLEGRKGPS